MSANEDSRLSLVQPAPPEAVQAVKDTSGAGGQASKLVALAQGAFSFVRDDAGKVFAVRRDGPNIALPLRGAGGLRTALAAEFYRRTGSAAAGSSLADALTVIEGMATTAPPELVALRTAEIGGAVVLDLGTGEGAAIVATPAGWSIAPTSPVLFRRTALSSPYPTPEAGQGLDALRQLVNLPEESFRLLVGWIVAAYLPNIPHPILGLLGEQGTAKSSAARLVMSLVDPSPAPLRTQPKELRGWAVTAAASWAITLDNVSHIPGWLSDTLCKAVTGDAVVDRALYSDDDVTVLSFRRVIALTSIDAGALAGDLAERMIPLELETLAPEDRKPEAQLAALFESSAPGIFAELLDLLCAVLKHLPGVQLEQAPRMADFARVLVALDTATGWETFGTYMAASSLSHRSVIESDPLAVAIVELLNGCIGNTWSGTAAELLARLPAPERPPRSWPKDARACGARIKRLAPALRAGGIEVDTNRTNQSRTITLTAHG